MRQRDHEPVDAFVGDDEIGAAPEQVERQPGRVRRADEGAQVVDIGRLGVEPRCAAHAHRGFRRQRLLPQQFRRARQPRLPRGRELVPAWAGGGRTGAARQPLPRLLVDIPRTDKRDQVARPDVAVERGKKLCGVSRPMMHRQRRGALLELRGNIGRGAAGDRRLARRIDVEQVHRVGRRERGGELALELCGAAVAVRLKNDEQPAAGVAAQALEQRADFRRVVRIILDHGERARG